MSERPSRRGASRAAKAEAAGAQLKALKEKGAKRLDTVEDADEKDNVYDVVRARPPRARPRGSATLPKKG